MILANIRYKRDILELKMQMESHVDKLDFGSDSEQHKLYAARMADMEKEKGKLLKEFNAVHKILNDHQDRKIQSHVGSDKESMELKSYPLSATGAASNFAASGEQSQSNIAYKEAMQKICRSRRDIVLLELKAQKLVDTEVELHWTREHQENIETDLRLAMANPSSDVAENPAELENLVDLYLETLEGDRIKLIEELIETHTQTLIKVKERQTATRELFQKFPGQEEKATIDIHASGYKSGEGL